MTSTPHCAPCGSSLCLTTNLAPSPRPGTAIRPYLLCRGQWLHNAQRPPRCPAAAVPPAPNLTHAPLTPPLALRLIPAPSHQSPCAPAAQDASTWPLVPRPTPRSTHTLLRTPAEGSGYITRDDLHAALRPLCPPEEIDRLMRGADTSGDGRIDYEEFCDMMRRWVPAHPNPNPLTHTPCRALREVLRHDAEWGLGKGGSEAPTQLWC